MFYIVIYIKLAIEVKGEYNSSKATFEVFVVVLYLNYIFICR